MILGKKYYDCAYVNGELDGEVVVYYPDGAILSVENYKKGSRFGKSITFW